MLLDIIIFAQIILVIILKSTTNYNTIIMLKRIILTTFIISMLFLIMFSYYLNIVALGGLWLIEGSATIISFIISQKHKIKEKEVFYGSC